MFAHKALIYSILIRLNHKVHRLAGLTSSPVALWDGPNTKVL